MIEASYLHGSGELHGQKRRWKRSRQEGQVCTKLFHGPVYTAASGGSRTYISQEIITRIFGEGDQAWNTDSHLLNKLQAGVVGNQHCVSLCCPA